MAEAGGAAKQRNRSTLASALTLGLSECVAGEGECSACAGRKAEKRGPQQKQRRSSRYGSLKLHHLHSWRVLAQNHASTIFRATDVRVQEEVCVKRLEKSKAKQTPGVIEDFRREAHLLLVLDNPGVVRGKALLEDRWYLYLVQELGQRGDLFHLAEQFKHHCIPEAYVRDNIARPLLNALRDLHSRGIAHRDLKPENVVITSNGNVKLCDLGLAIETSRWPATAAVGTTEFQAPELVYKKQCSRRGRANSVPQPYDPKASDVWSLGALLYEALCGRSPFTASTRTRVEQNVLACRYFFPREVGLSEQCKDFLASCLQERAKRRPTVSQLLAHPWLSSQGKTYDDDVISRKIAPRSQSASNLSFHNTDAPAQAVLDYIARDYNVCADQQREAIDEADPQEQQHDSDRQGSPHSPHSKDGECRINGEAHTKENALSPSGQRQLPNGKSKGKRGLDVRNGRYFKKQNANVVKQELFRNSPQGVLENDKNQVTLSHTAAADDTSVALNGKEAVSPEVTNHPAHLCDEPGLNGTASASLKRKAAQKSVTATSAQATARSSTGTANNSSNRVLRALSKAASLAARTRQRPERDENGAVDYASAGLATSTHNYDATLPKRSQHIRLLMFNGSHPVFH